MAEMAEVMNQDVTNILKASNVQVSTKGNWMRSVRDKLKEERNFLAERRRRTTLKTLQSRAKGKSVRGDGRCFRERI